VYSSAALNHFSAVLSGLIDCNKIQATENSRESKENHREVYSSSALNNFSAVLRGLIDRNKIQAKENSRERKGEPQRSVFLRGPQ
jgi:hypothetical protein